MGEMGIGFPGAWRFAPAPGYTPLPFRGRDLLLQMRLDCLLGRGCHNMRSIELLEPSADGVLRCLQGEAKKGG